MRKNNMGLFVCRYKGVSIFMSAGKYFTAKAPSKTYASLNNAKGAVTKAQKSSSMLVAYK